MATSRGRIPELGMAQRRDFWVPALASGPQPRPPAGEPGGYLWAGSVHFYDCAASFLEFLEIEAPAAIRQLGARLTCIAPWLGSAAGSGR